MSLCKGKRLNENVNDAAKTILFVLAWRYSMLVRGRGHRRDFLSLGCTLFFTRLICALSIIRHCGHLDHTLHKETCHSAFRGRRIAVSILISVSSARWRDFSARHIAIRRSPTVFPSAFYPVLSVLHFVHSFPPLLLYYCFRSIRLKWIGSVNLVIYDSFWYFYCG